MSSPHDPPVERRLGRYVLREELGRGGMGVVFKAWDPARERTVAIKKLLANAEPDELSRFKREAQLTAGLRHTGVAEVFEVVIAGPGAPYVVMEFVAGRTLQASVKGGMRGEHAAALVAQVARVVALVHAAGVLHRDLKPQNVMLRADDSPVVLDFGLAKRREGGGSLTESGQILGTPGYMAPEQVQGARSVGVGADVYGLGAILYECLTGAPPFQGKTVINVLNAILRAPPRAPSELKPSVDPALEAICLRCLEKDPQDRYASALDLANALEAWKRGAAARQRASLGRGAFPISAAVVLGALGLLSVWGIAQSLDPGDEVVRAPAPPEQKDGGDSPKGTAPSDGPPKAAVDPDPVDAAASTTASTTAPANAHEALRRAFQLHDSGDELGALRSCLASLALEPKAAHAREARELLSLLEEATEPARTGLERFGLPQDSPLLEAHALLRGGAGPEQLSDAVAAALVADREPTATKLLVAAAILEEGGSPERAAALLEQAFDREPTSRVAMEVFYRWETSGRVLPMEGLESRLQAFRIEARLDPRHPGRAWRTFHLGVEALFKGDITEAIRSFTAAVLLEPEFPGSYRGVGIAAQALGRNGSAIWAFTHALALDPRILNGYVDRGVSRKENKDEAGAWADFERAVRRGRRRDADSGGTWAVIAGLLYGRQDYPGAIQAASRGISAAPDSPQAYFVRGSSRYMARDLREAEADLDRALDLGERDALAYAIRGGVRLARRDLRRALVDYEEFLRRKPNDPYAADVRAIVAKVRRDVAEAERR